MPIPITLPENVEDVLCQSQEAGTRILLSVIKEMKHDESDYEGKAAWNNWAQGPAWNKGGWNNWPQWRQ
jgi:hypothetical protein